MRGNANVLTQHSAGTAGRAAVSASALPLGITLLLTIGSLPLPTRSQFTG